MLAIDHSRKLSNDAGKTQRGCRLQLLLRAHPGCRRSQPNKARRASTTVPRPKVIYSSHRMIPPYENHGLPPISRQQRSRPMTSVAKKLGLSFLLFCCCAGMAAAQGPANPDSGPGNVLPVRTLRGYLMIVGVSIDDQGPYDFLIDTGTNTTLLAPELAAELKLTSRDHLQLASLSRAAALPRYLLRKITVGPASLSIWKRSPCRLPSSGPWTAISAAFWA